MAETVNPTKKMRKAFKEVIKGESYSKAMIKAGYTKASSKNPKNLVERKGWQELIDKHISEEALTKVHAEGLSATKKQFKNNNATGEIEEVSVEPDFAVRHKYLETGYKVRGRLKGDDPEDDKPKIVININPTLIKVYGKDNPIREVSDNS